MKTFFRNLLCATLAIGANTLSVSAAEDQIRVGIIGLDTGHVIAFTRTMNDPAAEGSLAKCKVVAAYPEGSPDIESSTSRVPKYTEEIQTFGVEIVDSIPALLEKVDAVLLETNDGRPHLEQLIPVLKAGKPVFIDKPIAGSLADAILIFKASEKYEVPLFSSSSLRFGPNSLKVRTGAIGTVVNAQTGSPASLEKTHPDLFWYGIHGVESLFTVMGTGCESVVRTKSDEGMIRVTGTWNDNRTGVFEERKGYGGTATGSNGTSEVGAYPGYGPLVVAIADYFTTGALPVEPAETLEIYAFMEAADESKRQEGAPVTLESVMTKAQKEAESRLGEIE